MQVTEIISNVDTLTDGIPIKNSFNAIFWILMSFNLIVFALVKTVTPGYFANLFSIAINNRQLASDINFNHLPALLLNFSYFNCIAAICWIFSSNSTPFFMLTLLLFIVGGAFIKIITIRIIAFLSDTTVGLNTHIFNHLIFFQLGSVLLTPVLILTHYLPKNYANLTLITLLIIICILIIAREFQSFVRAVQYKISIFYIILYLCTLELLPLMVMVRVLILKSQVLN